MYIGHDLGTGGNKTVLVDLEGRVHAEHIARYGLDHPRPGWAEQNPDDWWEAATEGVRAVTEGVDPRRLRGMAYAGQMLALVPMDANGVPTRPALSWLDHRADAQAARLVRRMGGPRMVKRLAGAVPSGKDLVAKLAWIRECEPAVHALTAGYGDATSYLVAQSTGRLAMDPTAAGATGVFDLDKRRWSRILSKLTGLDVRKMPPVVPSSSIAGTLTAAAAKQMDVPAGLPVAMGMADIPAAAVGSGAVANGEAHVYLGTSAWIGVSLDAPRNIPHAGIVSAPSAAPAGCLMIAESETAGACRDWIGAQLDVEAPEILAEKAPPGSDGLLFCPWMFGERSPVSDARIRAAFLNLSLTHTRAHMARAVLEGVALNIRWILDEIDATGCRKPGLRAIGGGARSDLWLQILADVTGSDVHRVAAPQLAGAVGAALMAAVAVGDLPNVAAIGDRVQIDATFRPRRDLAGTYEPLYQAMRQVTPALSRLGLGLRRNG